MIALFGESLESRWYREHSIKVHKQKLEAIKQRSKSTLKSSIQPLSVNLRKQSQEMDKKKEIERENMILFLKLNHIKQRKNSKSEPKGPKSLNFSLRKKEADKIINENYDFVKRFMDKPSFVSARQLQEEYQLQLGYKKTISKANLHKRLVKLASFEGKPGHLPPLDSSLIENINKVRTEDQSKLSNVEDLDSYNKKNGSIQETDNEISMKSEDNKKPKKIHKNEEIMKNDDSIEAKNIKENNILVEESLIDKPFVNEIESIRDIDESQLISENIDEKLIAKNLKVKNYDEVEEKIIKATEKVVFQEILEEIHPSFEKNKTDQNKNENSEIIDEKIEIQE